MIVPLDIAQELADEAVRIGTDDAGGEHYRLTYAPPQPVLQNLRYLSRTDLVTVWHSPQYRAILMASQGAGQLVLYQNQAGYDMAVQAAKQGIYPSLDRVR